MRPSLLIAAAALLGASCETPRSNAVAGALARECQALRTWSQDAIQPDETWRTAHFVWLDMPDSIAMYAGMSMTCPSGACRALDADQALYPYLSRATHYHDLQVLVDRWAACGPDGAVTRRRVGGQVIGREARWQQGDRQVDIAWASDTCALGHGDVSSGRQGCLSVRTSRSDTADASGEE